MWVKSVIGSMANIMRKCLSSVYLQNILIEMGRFMWKKRGGKLNKCGWIFILIVFAVLASSRLLL